MHVGKIYVYDNLIYHKEVANYYYKITPINSLFAPETQQTTLLEAMTNIITDVNMPGSIIIRPKAIDNKKIYQSYADNFKKYGKPEFLDLAKDYILSLKEILSKAIKYRYDIYLVFCDGREDLKKRKNIKLFGESNKPLTQSELELYQTAEKEIFKKLSRSVHAQKVSEDLALILHNYIAIPIEKKIIDYCVEESPMSLTYHYKQSNKAEFDELYTKTLVASKFERSRLEDITRANDVINSLQLESYPTDVFIKFDLEHTKDFKRDMAGKKESIKKAHKRYISLTDRKDKEAIKAQIVATSGMEADESIERVKVKWQMFLRIRSNSVQMLEKRADALMEKFSGVNIRLSQELGEQLSLANNLFPYRSIFRKYVQLTDISYFVNYNYLGGLYIGDEEEGMIESYTVPGKIPIFYNISKPLLGQTKTSSSVSVYAGETGGGKTQLADHRAFQNMIFKGMRVLTIDPKGDREKKIKLLGDRASHLKIGSDDCQDGMFDAYLINSNYEDALEQVYKDVDAMVRALGLRISVDYNAIVQAHTEMIKDVKNKIIPRATFTSFIEKLEKYDEYIARQIITLRRTKIGRLFYATEDTKYDSSFNLNKQYNLITFIKTPVPRDQNMDSRDDPNRLDNAIFALAFSRVQNIITNFMKQFGNEENILIVDEYKRIKDTPGGEVIIDNCARQVRSWQTHLLIITQSLSDISSSLLNNTGEIFVGSLKSSEEIEFVLDEMKLNNHQTVRSALIDRTTAEGADENKKYVFLMQDYNNRKCLTKLIIPRCFSEIFRTLKDDETVSIGGRQYE